jgi:D-tyrosyl-tRNA(Tyr) deacylase
VRAVLQRVREASVAVVEPDGPARETARIGPGLLALVGFSGEETPGDLAWMAEKIAGLRVFGPTGEFDRSLIDTEGELLVVSQFTLLADLRKGRRPDFTRAATAERARPLFEDLVARLAARLPHVRQGVFGAVMRVTLVNDGPATFVLDRGGAG